MVILCIAAVIIVILCAPEVLGCLQMCAEAVREYAMAGWRHSCSCANELLALLKGVSSLFRRDGADLGVS